MVRCCYVYPSTTRLALLAERATSCYYFKCAVHGAGKLIWGMLAGGMLSVFVPMFWGSMWWMFHKPRCKPQPPEYPLPCTQTKLSHVVCNRHNPFDFMQYHSKLLPGCTPKWKVTE